MGVPKIRSNQGLDGAQGFAGAEILRYIARLIAPKKRKLGAGLQDDRPEIKMGEVGVVSGRLSKGELDQASAVNGLAQQFEESIAAGWIHGCDTEIETGGM
jgi:hypothetical protein